MVLNEDQRILLEWVHGRELMWLVSNLSCFIALVSTLSLNFLDFTLRVFLISCIYGVMVVGWNYSFFKYIQWSNIKLELENKIDNNIRKTLRRTATKFEIFLYRLNDKQEITGVQDWVWWFVSGGSSVFWCAVFALGLRPENSSLFTITCWTPYLMSLLSIIFLKTFGGTYTPITVQEKKSS